MIKAKVVSITYSESIGGIPKLDLETYLEDPVVQELFCGADFWDGLDIIIMTKEDYESLRKRLNEKEGEICKLIVANKDLEEKLAQEAGEVDIHPDGTMIFKTKRVSELEKKVKNLEEENKDLKKKVERLKEELFFFYKGLKYNERVSELEKEVEELNKSKSDTWLELNTVKAENEKLKEENKALKEDKLTIKITGGLFYKED